MSPDRPHKAEGAEPHEVCRDQKRSFYLLPGPRSGNIRPGLQHSPGRSLLRGWRLVVRCARRHGGAPARFRRGHAGDPTDGEYG